MKNIKILAVILSSLMIKSNIAGSAELETLKNDNIKGLKESLQSWDVFGSIGGVASVVWDAKSILGAVKTDVISGNAFACLSATAKEARKSERLIISYPAFALDLNLTAIGAMYKTATHPYQTITDIKDYALKLAHAEWLVLSDSKIVAGLNDPEAVARLLTKKED